MCPKFCIVNIPVNFDENIIGTRYLDWMCINTWSFGQVTLLGITAASVSWAGPGRTVTSAELPLWGRTFTLWAPVSCRSSWTFWIWPKPPSTPNTSSPHSTGWACWDPTAPSRSSATSPSTTSSSGSTITLCGTHCWVRSCRDPAPFKHEEPFNKWLLSDRRVQFHFSP